jgi:hypothetical protein
MCSGRFVVASSRAIESHGTVEADLFLTVELAMKQFAQTVLAHYIKVRGRGACPLGIAMPF